MASELNWNLSIPNKVHAKYAAERWVDDTRVQDSLALSNPQYASKARTQIHRQKWLRTNSDSRPDALAPR